jgi:mRNA-degrading endonuclease RelE of RelBE toxin-antitoxin system
MRRGYLGAVFVGGRRARGDCLPERGRSSSVLSIYEVRFAEDLERAAAALSVETRARIVQVLLGIGELAEQVRGAADSDVPFVLTIETRRVLYTVDSARRRIAVLAIDGREQGDSR